MSLLLLDEVELSLVEITLVHFFYVCDDHILCVALPA